METTKEILTGLIGEENRIIQLRRQEEERADGKFRDLVGIRDVSSAEARDQNATLVSQTTVMGDAVEVLADQFESFGNEVVSELSDAESEIYNDTGKAVELWTGDDFPEQPRVNSRGFNRLLQGYVSIRRRIFPSGKTKQQSEKPVSVMSGERTEPPSCAGISGLCALLGLLLASVAYVAYCCHVSSTDDPQMTRLFVFAALFWFGLLLALFRRLVHQDSTQGGCFTPFSKLSDGWSNTRRRMKTSLVALKERTNCGKKAESILKLCVKVFTISAMLLVVCLCLVFLVILVNPRNLISLSGIALNLLFCIAISRHPGKVIFSSVYHSLSVSLCKIS
ncbi:unnamed protein product [Dibothriocephalus latus]|uniref:Uncharacterized protein n=1 Tax=Dibothriocephalus latus TaxID=60516 RepID=A0A3P7LKJ3_DIBLA|nr:unnamed protein product [Dibothriocephalus latus]